MTAVLAAQENPVLPNATFFAELLAFLIILFVLWKWVVPPIQRSMQQRQDAIRIQLEEGQRAKERLEAAEADYRRALDEARQDASRMREEAQEQRRAIVDQAASEARERAQEILDRAEAQLEAERHQAIVQLRNEIGSLAVELAGRIVGESLEDEARQGRIVERFLTELEESGQAGAGERSGAGPGGRAERTR
ncbi:MAG: F0F1 ATP synthase subunit B [Streptosporangiales bacterium]|nr:F0F1 ATP synthase subunit B [Streptosporangiales bacterium]